MTDQRTLKKIITEQRELIVKLKIAFIKQRQQIDDCETFLDMLWKDMELSKLFRTDLAKIRCRICNISDCSTREDREECLRIFESDYQQEKQEKKTGMRKYCICGQKLTVAKEDGMFDGKGSIYCPACGLIHRKKPKQSNKPKEMERKKDERL